MCIRDRYMKSEAADERGIAKIIESYSSLRTLSDNDLGIIKGMLVYPYKFLKLCNEHYNKRRVDVYKRQDIRSYGL